MRTAKTLVFAGRTCHLVGFIVIRRNLLYVLGSVFASISAVEIITNLLASVTENSIYAATVSVVNGFVFLAMAGYIFIDFLLLS